MKITLQKTIHNLLMVIALLVLGKAAFAQAPTITSFSPTKDTVGATVTIVGTNFSTVISNNIVFFGAAKAVVNSANATSLVVTVPSGATYGSIKVLNLTTGLIVSSIAHFSCKITSSKNNIDSTEFENSIDLLTGNNYNRVDIGDLDGDGKIDIVTTDFINRLISIVRNTSVNGIVSFDYKIQITGRINSTVEALSLSDVDGDGKLDLIVSDKFYVNVYKNISTIGSINFAPVVSFNLNNVNIGIDVNDLDGDGKPEIVTSNVQSSSISIFKNTSTSGTISFATKIDITTNSSPREISINDINDDGKKDICVVNGNSNNVSIFKNNSSLGTLSFATKVDFLTGSNPNGLSIGDLDGDGKLDLAIANYGSGSLSILKNTSTTTTISFASKVDFPVASGLPPNSVSIYDVNGDGKLDLIDDYSNILRNTSTVGTININSFTSKVQVLVNTNSARKIMIGDLDGDKLPDLIWGQYVVRNNAILVNNANLKNIVLSSKNISPSFVSSIRNYTSSSLNLVSNISITPTSSNNGSLIKYSLNGGPYTLINSGSTSSLLPLLIGDNIINLYVKSVDSTCANIYSIVVNKSDTPPVINSVFPLSDTVGSIITINGARFNSTASNNIVFFGATKATVISGTASTLSVIVPLGAKYGPISVINTETKLIANSKSNFTPKFKMVKYNFIASDFRPKVDFGSGNGPSDIEIGDLDGDGKPEIVNTNYGSDSISIYKNNSVNGVLNLANKIDVLVGINPNIKPYSIALADLNSDGKLDIITVDYDNSSISVLKNTSTSNNISFSKAISFQVNANPNGISIGDINGDGKLDLAVSFYFLNKISILKNTGSNGSINFDNQREFVTQGNPNFITMGDLDGDGKLDLAVTCSSRDILVFKNNSTSDSIILSSHIGFPMNYYSSNKIIMCDFDGDNKLDLATITSNLVSILKNNSSVGSLNFGSAIELKSINFLEDIKIADFNGDGKPDLVLANGSLCLFRNKSTVGSLTSNSFADSILISLPSGTKVCAGDINLDGKPDILTANTYANSISIFRNFPVPSSNAGLTNIIPNKGILYSNFDSTILSYKMFLNYVDSNISFDLREAEENQVINVRINNGSYQYIPNTSISQLLSLNIGNNIIEIKVMAQDSVTFKTYLININRVGIAPTISSFNPISDTIGAIVTINGTNFNPSVLNNIVYFGPVKANVISASTNMLTVNVPSGATYSPITVLNTAVSQTATSRLSFTPSRKPYNDSILASGFTFGTIVGGINFGQSYYTSIGDLNNDGKPDLCANMQFMSYFEIQKNTSNANNISFNTKVNFPATSKYGNLNTRNSLSDLDGDGKLDLISHSGSREIVIRRNNSTVDSLMFDNQISLNSNFAYNYGELGIQDLDGDGKPEIASVNSDNKISIFKNIGGSGFINFNDIPFDINLSAVPKTIKCGDLDGDGKVDLLVNYESDSVVSIFKNNSTTNNFSFAPKVNFITGSNLESFLVADINGDDKLDIATANYDKHLISILKNNTISSTISFAQKQDFPVDSFPKNINIGDINGDGKPDLTTLHYYFRGSNMAFISMRRNTSTVNNITFANKTDFSIRNGYDNVFSYIWDLNGDAKPEILFTLRGLTVIDYFKNNPVILSTNANLSNIAISNGNLSPSFNKDSLSYKTSVNYLIDSMSITPFKADSFASIQVKINNGNYSNIISGVSSNRFPLIFGINNISIKVTAQNGTTIKIYTLSINRFSVNAKLSNINLIGTPYLPTFQTDTLTYAANVLFSLKNVMVSSILSDTLAKMQIKMNSGAFTNINNKDTSGLLPLNLGLNTIAIKVTAQDTSITRTYSINITRAAAIAPSAMSYAAPTIIATRTITNINNSVTYSGDSITGFSITPTLPNGVSFNTLTGRISGVPTVVFPQTVFTITGTNSSGSTTANFTLTVNRVAPSNLKYNDSIVIATRTITNINSSVTYAGDSIANFSITPSLPTGLSLNTTTGLISGIPTVTLPQTTFTITGTNNGGSSSASFRLTVNKIAPSNLKYSDSIVMATRTITNINSSVTYAGDSITNFSITPSLPNGLSLNTATGLISGIPTVTLTQTTFTITGTNNGGSTTASFRLKVNRIAPSNLKYNDSIVVATRTITNINSSVTYAGDSITNFSITPSLPLGLSLNTSTGLISGIPTVTLPQTTFTITGTNNGGSSTASFRLTVNKIAPSNLKYTDSLVVATKTITNINSSVTYAGDSIANFSITPSLPNGLSLNTATGLISGIPLVTLPQTTFTITGTNNGGSTTASFRLTVNRIAPSNLKYNDSIVIATRTITNINSSVTYSGDSITNFSITPALPSGVTLNTSTGLISGIPTVNVAQTVFTITGSNSGGSSTASFRLTVNKIAPSNLKYTDSLVVATRTITNINSSVTYAGDSITNFSITPALPTGVTLNTSTGLISGIPTVNMAQTVFTITGLNSAGSTTANFTLTVNPPVSIKPINVNTFSNINIKPNPFSSQIEIDFMSNIKETTKLVITDAVGKEVFVKTIQSNIGNNNIIIDEMTNLNSGIYFARLEGNSGYSPSFKLVKN